MQNKKLLKNNWVQCKTFVKLLCAKQDFCSNVLGVKQDFCLNMVGAKKRSTFVQTFWIQRKTLFKHFGCKARQKNCANILGPKQDFVQTFWVQEKTFVQTF